MTYPLHVVYPTEANSYSLAAHIRTIGEDASELKMSLAAHVVAGVQGANL